jgi:hypothetical protein
MLVRLLILACVEFWSSSCLKAQGQMASLLLSSVDGVDALCTSLVHESGARHPHAFVPYLILTHRRLMKLNNQ